MQHLILFGKTQWMLPIKYQNQQDRKLKINHKQQENM